MKAPVIESGAQRMKRRAIEAATVTLSPSAPARAEVPKPAPAASGGMSQGLRRRSSARRGI